MQSERNIFTLNSAIAAVSEGNYGRLGRNQQGIYTTGNAQSQLDPDLWEMPGMMPEIVPGGDFGANINRLFTERSMVMQAWGAYGTIWPVVHQWLGVSPDLGRGRVAVVPQIPAGQPSASGRDIRLGSGSIDVSASRSGKTDRHQGDARSPRRPDHRGGPPPGFRHPLGPSRRPQGQAASRLDRTRLGGEGQRAARAGDSTLVITTR